MTLATGVIVWHSFLFTGQEDVLHPPILQLLSKGWVDGFFAISGFLITASWLNKPRFRTYFAARSLRIFPGLWVCLIVTAFVIAPIGVAMQGRPGAKLLLSTAPIEYVVKNCAALTFQFDIGGTPQGVPVPGIWNGSLWTLQWELFCYIFIAVVGGVGLLGRRWFIPVAAVLAFSWVALVPDSATELPTVAQAGARFAAMFMAGALLYHFRQAIPARWSLVVASALVVLAASFLTDYRLLAAIPLAYLVIVSGALIHTRRLRLRTDLSYGVYIYAGPIQQLLVIGGLASLNPLVFAIVATIATLPLAAFSWFLIEKPALRLKSRFKPRATAAAVEPRREDRSEFARKRP